MAKDDVATISSSGFDSNSASGSAFQLLKGGGGISAGGSSQLKIQQGSGRFEAFVSHRQESILMNILLCSF